MKYWVILATLAVAFAQTAPPSKNIVGAVTAVDSGGKQLTVQTDNSGPAYAVKIEDATKLMRLPAGEKDIKKAEPIQFSDIGVGDRVLARGPVSAEDKTFPARTVVVMTKSDVAKVHDEERQAWQKGDRGNGGQRQPRLQRGHSEDAWSRVEDGRGGRFEHAEPVALRPRLL